MVYLIIGIILLIVFIISLIKEPRRLINVVELVLSLIFILIGIGCIFEKNPAVYNNFLLVFYILIPLIMFIIAVFLINNFFELIKKEKISLPNCLSLFMGIEIIITMILQVMVMIVESTNIYFLGFLMLSAFFAIYFTFTFIALFIYSMIYLLIPKKLDCDYIVIHGCGLSKGLYPTPLLKGRIDKAINIYNRCIKRPTIICSGGQGADEKISEAQAIYNYLIKNNIPKDKLLCEEKSTTTYENLLETKKLINDSSKKIIFVTNNYHVFRTSLYARKLKLNAQGVGSKTALYYFPSAFIREYIAIIVKCKIPALLVFLFWLVLFITLLFQK